MVPSVFPPSWRPLSESFPKDKDEEFGRKRGIPLKNKKGEVATTIEEVKKMLITNEPANLAKMLEPFDIFLPVVRGDLEVIEQIAYELCEDQHNNGVIYFEGRYAPHLLTDEKVCILA